MVNIGKPNLNTPTVTRAVEVTGVSSASASGIVVVPVPIRRVRAARANFEAKGVEKASGGVCVAVVGHSGSCVDVQFYAMISQMGAPGGALSGLQLSGGTLTVWAEGDD